MTEMATANDILNFWFVECEPSAWFVKDPTFDAMITTRFGRQVETAVAGGLSEWRD